MSSSSKEFKVLVYQLSEELSRGELDAVVYTEGLPPKFKKESALAILAKLEMMGEISEKKHKALEEILRTVHRNDLAKRVEKFSKPRKCKKQQSTIRYYPANLDWALVKTGFLIEHLQNTADSAPGSVEAGKIAAAKGFAEQLKKTLLDAKALQDQYDSSESETSPQNTLKKDFDMELVEKLQPKLPKGEYVNQPRQPTRQATQDRLHPSVPTLAAIASQESTLKFASQETTNDDGIYEQVSVHLQPRCPNYEFERARLENQNDSSSLVTGVVKAKKKPTPPPKPPKLRKSPPKITGLQTIPEPEETDDEDEGNYTGGTTGGSGSGTGSGFVDPTPYLRVDMKNTKSSQLPSIEDTPPTHVQTAATGYYKAIRKDEVGGPSYYKTARDDGTRKYLDTYNTVFDRQTNDEGIYELYTSENRAQQQHSTQH